MHSETVSITMTRRSKRIYISISTVLVILGGLYASSPWLVAQVIRSQLATYGMRDVQVQVDYPSLSGLMLQGLSFNGLVANNELRVEVPIISVNYQLSTLLTGQLQRVHIPQANLQMRLSDIQAGQQTMALPIGLLSGQWLTDIPIGELKLDRLQLDASTHSSKLYHMWFYTELREQSIQLVGELLLRQSTAPLTFLAGASRNGQAHIHLIPNVEDESPLLTLEVRPQAHDPSQSKPDQNQALILKGQLHTQFNRLLPVVTPVLSSFYPFIHSVEDLQGELSSQWRAKVVSDQWQVTGKVNIASLGGQWDKLTLPRSEWQGTYQLDINQFTLQSMLKSFAQKVQVDLSVQHDINTGKGQTIFNLVPIEFNGDKLRLSNIIKDGVMPFDLTQGQVSGSGTISWNKLLDVKGQLNLNGIGGHYNEMIFEGMDSTIRLTYENGLKTRKAVPMTVKHVNIGFPINDVSMNYTLSPNLNAFIPVINVNQLEARMLGGRVFSGPFDYDVSRDKNTFILQLEGLGVHELMELERQEGLSGDGLLDGKIPIEIINKEIVIRDGKLTAREPGGVIKYTPTAKVAALAKTNTSMNLMVNALSHFKYDVLDVNTNYKPGGDMQLQVRLQGQNPDWQDGQPINLNLNLQENIPALLRSLQLSSEISEQVKKRVLDKSNKAR